LVIYDTPAARHDGVAPNRAPRETAMHLPPGLSAHLARNLHEYTAPIDRGETTMAQNDFLDSVRDNLNGRPGQPMLFGVCRTLAEKTGLETWLVRVAAILLVLFFTFPTVVAYVLLGLFMDETADRTRGIFQGLFLTLQEGVEKVVDGIGDVFRSGGNTSGR
jgi:phage shock protein PspC (stress-responsive transcriptional regulator)